MTSLPIEVMMTDQRRRRLEVSTFEADDGGTPLQHLMHINFFSDKPNNFNWLPSFR
jgi:hypothetical protein